MRLPLQALPHPVRSDRILAACRDVRAFANGAAPHAATVIIAASMFAASVLGLILADGITTTFTVLNAARIEAGQ